MLSRVSHPTYLVRDSTPRPPEPGPKQFETLWYGHFLRLFVQWCGSTALYVKYSLKSPFSRGSTLFHAAPPSVVPRAAADGGPSPTSLPGRHCRLPAAAVSMLARASMPQLAASPFCAAAAAASPCGAVWLRTRALVRVRVRVLGLGLGF